MGTKRGFSLTKRPQFRNRKAKNRKTETKAACVGGLAAWGDKIKKVWYTGFMRRVTVVLFCIGTALLSCVSQNGSNNDSMTRFAEQSVPDAASGIVEQEEAPALKEEFDPKNPPVEIYTVTKREIQGFIQKVDSLIKAKNYAEWVKLLSPDYYELINSTAFLAEVSQQPRLKSQNIVLNTSKDYFLNVVVTSRANLWASDIEFVEMTRVMAFIVNQSGQRIRIYTLDKVGDSWKIVD
jgi:murein DD-endopeptidase MepM/ murein hydrolase activator NlpD